MAQVNEPPSGAQSGSRVATLSVGLAEVVDRVSVGPHRDVVFSRAQLRELRYAGLLHEFGKVGVREQVLVKQKKLYPQDLEVIRHRFGYVLQQSDLDFERERAEFVIAHGQEHYEAMVAKLDTARGSRRAELQGFLDAIVKANEPTSLRKAALNSCRRLARAPLWISREVCGPCSSARSCNSWQFARVHSMRTNVVRSNRT